MSRVLSSHSCGTVGERIVGARVKNGNAAIKRYIGWRTMKNKRIHVAAGAAAVLVPVLRQNVIRAENGASPCRKRLSERRELLQGCSADARILCGSSPLQCPTYI